MGIITETRLQDSQHRWLQWLFNRCPFFVLTFYCSGTNSTPQTHLDSHENLANCLKPKMFHKTGKRDHCVIAVEHHCNAVVHCLAIEELVVQSLLAPSN